MNLHPQISTLVQSVEGWILLQAASFAHTFGYAAKDDFAQEGRIAAMASAAKFDASRGITFLTFASRRIRGAMHRYGVTHSRIVRVPEKAFYVTPQSVTHLDACEDANDGPWGDVVDELLGAAAMDDGRDGNTASDCRDLLGGELQRLDARTRLIIQRRFILGHTLEAIGKDLDLTRERVRQIEAATLRLLRQRLTSSFREFAI